MHVRYVFYNYINVSSKKYEYQVVGKYVFCTIANMNRIQRIFKSFVLGGGVLQGKKDRDDCRKA